MTVRRKTRFRHRMVDSLYGIGNGSEAAWGGGWGWGATPVGWGFGAGWEWADGGDGHGFGPWLRDPVFREYLDPED